MSDITPGLTPTRPDGGTPKKNNVRNFLIGVGIVVAIGAVAGSSGADSTGSTSSKANSDTVDSYEVTAEMVVDVMGASKQAQFCDAWAAVPSYNLALDAFKEGYGSSMEGVSAEEVFDELLSRC